MSKLIADLEQGAVALIHTLEQPPTDGNQLPEEVAHAAGVFAGHLGLNWNSLPAHLKGWVFDVLTHGVNSISGAPTPTAVAEETQTPVPAVGSPQEAAQEPLAANHEVPPPAAQAVPAAVGAVEQPVGHADAGAVPATPDNTQPVTEPAAGHQICPNCNGFRTVITNGTLVTCLHCDGNGQIPVAGTPPAAA